MMTEDELLRAVALASMPQPKRIAVEPISFSDLEAIGIGDRLPTPRNRPYVCPSGLRVSHTRAVYWPPFEVVDGKIVAVGYVDTMAGFGFEVGRRHVTPCGPAPAMENGCWLFMTGSQEPQYVTTRAAAEALRVFAQEQNGHGDLQFRRFMDEIRRGHAATSEPTIGYARLALARYELAASTGSPESYARMLMLRDTGILPLRRKDWLVRMLAESLRSAGISDNPESYIEKVFRDVLSP